MYRLPPSSLRGCAAPRDSVCACPFLRARAFPRFCFRVHSGLYYDGSAFVGPLRITKLRTSRHIGQIVIAVAVHSRANHRRDISR